MKTVLFGTNNQVQKGGEDSKLIHGLKTLICIAAFDTQKHQSTHTIHTIYWEFQATLASWIPTLRILAEIWRNTAQVGKYRTVDTYSATAGARPTYCIDADVASIARNELT